jgi:hypothetical protein
MEKAKGIRLSLVVKKLFPLKGLRVNWKTWMRGLSRFEASLTFFEAFLENLGILGCLEFRSARLLLSINLITLGLAEDSLISLSRFLSRGLKRRELVITLDNPHDFEVFEEIDERF